MSAGQPLQVERTDDGVASLTLSSPDRRNAMTTALTGAWRRTMAELRIDRDLRCVVVTGAGSAFWRAGSGLAGRFA